ncbi:MAG: hypothetical protein LBL91_05610 [Lachnospiraceae bacterium]|nr:hypothetical protein [Lachnospiraceae bacterium]
MKKVISIIITVILALWALLLIFDFIRAVNQNPPLIKLSEKTYQYQDGYAKEYVSLGYKYFEAQSNGTLKFGFAPLWKSIDSLR